jgi:hypothetical protein
MARHPGQGCPPEISERVERGREVTGVNRLDDDATHGPSRRGRAREVRRSQAGTGMTPVTIYVRNQGAVDAWFAVWPEPDPPTAQGYPKWTGVGRISVPVDAPTPGRPIWSLPDFEELDRLYVQSPDPGQGTFEEKLHVQIGGGSPDAIQLVRRPSRLRTRRASGASLPRTRSWPTSLEPRDHCVLALPASRAGAFPTGFLKAGFAARQRAPGHPAGQRAAGDRDVRVVKSRQEKGMDA